MTFKQLKDFFEKNNLDPNTKIFIDTRDYVDDEDRFITPEFSFVNKAKKTLVLDGCCSSQNTVIPPFEDYPESEGWETFKRLKKIQGAVDEKPMDIIVTVTVKGKREEIKTNQTVKAKEPTKLEIENLIRKMFAPKGGMNGES